MNVTFSDKDLPFICYHPGETLSEKLQEMGLSNTEFSEISGLTVEKIRKITAGENDIDEPTAVILEKYTQIPAKFWLKLQENHNLYKLDLSARSQKKVAVPV